VSKRERESGREVKRWTGTQNIILLKRIKSSSERHNKKNYALVGAIALVEGVP
jgi:hypothetical protein